MYLSILNYVGDIAFAAGGILAARAVTKNRFTWLIAAVLTAFGGGFFLRDLLTLGTKPSILGSLHEIAMTIAFAAVMASVLYYAGKSSKEERNSAARISALLKKALLVADSLGILAFAAFGYERGSTVGGSLLAAVLCGWFTTVGGGILARVVISIPKKESFTACLRNLLNRNVPYYAYGLVVVMAYGLAAQAIGKNVALIALTPLAVLLGFLTDKEITARG